MPIKESGPADLHVIDRFDGETTDGGVGWLAYPDEGMRRASHALAVDGEVWVLDPVDAPGLDDLLAEYGSVRGVVVCLDRHTRDAAAVARRHDVSVYLPEWMAGAGDDLDAPVAQFGDELADTGYRTLRLRDSSLPPWHEVGLYHEADGTLYVPESVGTAPFFRSPGERLGVHPMLRLTPPRRQFGTVDPDRVLVGHGEGVFDDAAGELRRALRDARRNAPELYAGTLKSLLGG